MKIEIEVKITAGEAKIARVLRFLRRKDHLYKNHEIVYINIVRSAYQNSNIVEATFSAVKYKERHTL